MNAFNNCKPTLNKQLGKLTLKGAISSATVTQKNYTQPKGNPSDDCENDINDFFQKWKKIVDDKLAGNSKDEQESTVAFSLSKRKRALLDASSSQLIDSFKNNLKDLGTLCTQSDSLTATRKGESPGTDCASLPEESMYNAFLPVAKRKPKLKLRKRGMNSCYFSNSETESESDLPLVKMRRYVNKNIRNVTSKTVRL